MQSQSGKWCGSSVWLEYRPVTPGVASSSLVRTARMEFGHLARLHSLFLQKAEHGIEWVHFPLSEKPGVSWQVAYSQALPLLLDAYNAGKKMVVHCDFGANRSRTLIEAFYYILTGEEYDDEHKGEINHLAYNCKLKHLPPLEETETWLKTLAQ